MSQLESIAQFFQAGGPFMWPILLVFAVTLAITAERVWVLFLNREGLDPVDSGSADDLLARVAGGRDRGPGAADAVPGALGRIARRILSLDGEGRDRLRDASDESVVLEAPRLTARLNYLPLLANAAVLLGLLGTIFGLKESFTGVAATSAMRKAELLSSGIAVALNTTAFGLMVAVPTLIAHTFLRNRAEKVLDALDAFAMRLIDAVMRTPEAADQAPSPARGAETLRSDRGRERPARRPALAETGAESALAAGD